MISEKNTHRSACALSSSVHSSEEAKGTGKGRGRFRGERGALPPNLGVLGSGIRAIYTPPSLARISISFPVPEIQGQSRAAAGGHGVGRGCECEGTPLHAGAQWAKLRRASGHRYISELRQDFKHWFPRVGSPFRAGWRPLPARPQRFSGGPGPPRVPVYLRVRARGQVCLTSLLPSGDSGPPKLARHTPACVGKVSGREGTLGVSSPAPRRQWGFLACSFLPVSSSRPALPS